MTFLSFDTIRVSSRVGSFFPSARQYDNTVIQHSSIAGIKEGYLLAVEDRHVDSRQMTHIEQHRALLEELGLHTMEGVKRFEGKIVERTPGRRDVLKIEVPPVNGLPAALFLKRHWKVNRMKSLLTFPKRLRIESLASREWENAKRLQRAGFKTAPLVAHGEECGLLGEKFSFLITEVAPGSCSLEEFYQECHEHPSRRHVFDSLAFELQRLHSAGMSMPDLFARHIFFSAEAECLSFCFIDVARLETGHPLSSAQKARSLAALNVSAPAHLVSTAERLRFLQRYAGGIDLKLFSLVRKRTYFLLRRRRYQRLHLSGDNCTRVPGPASSQILRL